MPRIRKEFKLPKEVLDTITRIGDRLLPDKSRGKYRVGQKIYTKCEQVEGTVYGFVKLIAPMGLGIQAILCTDKRGGRYDNGWYVISAEGEEV